MLKYIKAEISDFDGVFYPLTYIPNKGFSDLCDLSKVEALKSILPDVDEGLVKELAAMSYKKYGDGTAIFIPLAEEHGICQKAFRQAAHERFHDRLFINTMDMYPNLVSGSDSLSAKFAEVGKVVTQAILSHANINNWALRVLRFRGDEGVIKRENMWGLDDWGFILKSKSAKPFGMMLNHLSVNPEETMFVEDNLTNIKVVKEAYPNVTCAFVQNSDYPTPQAEVDKFAYITVYNQEELKDIMREEIVRKKHPSLVM